MAMHGAVEAAACGTARTSSGTAVVLRLVTTCIMCVLFVLPAPADAEEPVERLDRFLRDIVSLEAAFAQVVTDVDDRELQSSSGIVRFARPGRFRWDYLEPFEQIIVADGQFVWVYDIDLAQATVTPLDAALGSAPVTLLGGEYRPLDIEFAISDSGRREMLDWVTLIPKQQESDFSMIELGLGDEWIDTMILHDQLGQKTVIWFTDLVTNPEFSPEVFIFVTPPGVDVIRN